MAVPVLATVKEQLLFHKGYTLVSSGHSLGGALAVLAGISLSENFDDRYGSFISLRTVYADHEYRNQWREMLFVRSTSCRRKR